MLVLQSLIESESGGGVGVVVMILIKRFFLVNESEGLPQF